jgi:hypothetical protein
VIVGSPTLLLQCQHAHLEVASERPAKRGLEARRSSDVGSDVAADPRVALPALSASADDRAEIHVGQEEQVPPAMVILRSDCFTPVGATMAAWPLCANSGSLADAAAWATNKHSPSRAGVRLVVGAQGKSDPRRRWEVDSPLSHHHPG